MRSVTFAAFILSLIAALTGVATAPAAAVPMREPAGLAPGTHERTLVMDGFWEREYLLRVPPDASKRPRPLVVALHGGLNDMHFMREDTGLDRVADREGFLVAYPNGFMRTWNAGGCCAFARMAGIDDVAFLDKLIATLVGSGMADPSRIYVTGFSNGGGMAYRYACERSGTVAAIGVVSGSMAVPCQPGNPVSVMAFHGTADFSIPFGGGGAMDWNNGTPFPSVWDVMNDWRRINDLSSFLRITLDRPKTTCRATRPGTGGLEVELCTIYDGGHEWPDGDPQWGSATILASPMLWDFFREHARG